MDGSHFDELARRLAGRGDGRMSRRAALGAVAGGVLAALGLRQGAGAEVTQAYCGNKSCRTNPGKCNDGCVCCVWPNKNSRCMPPGRCTGQEVGGPTTTTTTTSTTTSTTTEAPTTTTTTTTASPGPCGNGCSGETPYCVGGACVECRNGDDCDDGITCTVDDCNQQTGRCEYVPISDLCAPTEVCLIGHCDPPNGDPVTGCVFEPTVCPDDGIGCTRNFCDPQFSQCVTIPDSSLCISEDACFNSVCVPSLGDPTTGCMLEPISCDDHVACTVDTCFEGVCSHTRDDSLCPPPFPLALLECLTPVCDPEHDENSETGCRFVDTCNVGGVLHPDCGGTPTCSCQAIQTSPGVFDGRCIPAQPV